MMLIPLREKDLVVADVGNVNEVKPRLIIDREDLTDEQISYLRHNIPKSLEIVRQLKLWIKEIEETPQVKDTAEAGWIRNTVAEILECEYDVNRLTERSSD